MLEGFSANIKFTLQQPIGARRLSDILVKTHLKSKKKEKENTTVVIIITAYVPCGKGAGRCPVKGTLTGAATEGVEA